jgi:hypothetical protein
MKLYGVSEECRLQVDITRASDVRRLEVESWLQTKVTELYDTLVICCHGWAHGLSSLGYRDSTVTSLTTLLPKLLTNDAVIVLYACSTGDGEGDQRRGPGGEHGFADTIRDHLSAVGMRCRIYAHSTAGHAFANPYVRYFDCGVDDTVNGKWLVDPSSSDWPLWRSRLKDEKDRPDSGNLRMRYPFMSVEEVLSELRA